VLTIDIKKALCLEMDNVYRQAVMLYKEEFMYWFDDKDLEELYENNRSFQVESAAEQLLLYYYNKPGTEAEATHCYNTTYLKTLLGNTQNRN
jgi:predicted P-loop ATPase